MTLKEAKQIAANPSEYPNQLRLAHLKLGNAVLRAFPSSPAQAELQAMVSQIETMPREMWAYFR